MCELLGASSSVPRSYSRWLGAFRLRGGQAADNADGWGVAFWPNGKAIIEKSPEPGWNSPRLAAMTERADSNLVIAHVRKAHHPPFPGFMNTHPFAHFCCGQEWVFAHNGLVPVVTGCAAACHPKGETDSEMAFCRLLAGIAGDYDLLDHGHWVARLAQVASEIAASGKFNFLLSDGRLLVAYGHDRLHYLEESSGRSLLAMVSTEPITDDDWREFAPGELRVYRDGALLACHDSQLPAAVFPGIADFNHQPHQGETA